MTGTVQPLWWGRVFTAEGRGGNHTAVLPPGPAGEPHADRAAIAAALNVPDTGFVLDDASGRTLMRTFSPVEELAQCAQTSLAAVVALDLPEGVAHPVRHVEGEELHVYREGQVCWARRETDARARLQETRWPEFVHADPDPHRPPVIVRQARSRMHLGCADAGQLEALQIDPADVLALCAASGTNGLVLAAPLTAGVLRVRVYTTSLAGTEDCATGGAVLDVGRLEAQHGVRGDLLAIQGPDAPQQRSHLHLRIAGPHAVELGGRVLTLARGTLELP